MQRGRGGGHACTGRLRNLQAQLTVCMRRRCTMQHRACGPHGASSSPAQMLLPVVALKQPPGALRLRQGGSSSPVFSHLHAYMPSASACWQPKPGSARPPTLPSHPLHSRPPPHHFPHTHLAMDFIWSSFWRSRVWYVLAMVFAALYLWLKLVASASRCCCWGGCCGCAVDPSPGSGSSKGPGFWLWAVPLVLLGR